MALFESYERRVDKINSVLAEYGISSIEECKEITLAKGVDCDKIVRETQPSALRTLSGLHRRCAIAIKSGCTKLPTLLPLSASASSPSASPLRRR